MTSERTVAFVKNDLAEAINEMMSHYPKSRSAIMPALYLAQEKYGVIDGVVYQAIASILDIPEIWVFEVATFYTMYNRKQMGRFHLQLCTNISCMLLGAYDVLEHIENSLNIKKGETTSDGLFTLSVVECIGSCDVAPALMVNDVYHNCVTTKDIDALLNDLTLSVKEPAQ